MAEWRVGGHARPAQLGSHTPLQQPPRNKHRPPPAPSLHINKHLLLLYQLLLYPPILKTIHKPNQASSPPKMYQPILSLLLQLWLAALALAAPIADETFSTTSSSVGYGTGGGIVGLIILVLDVLVFSAFQPPLAVFYLSIYLSVLVTRKMLELGVQIADG